MANFTDLVYNVTSDSPSVDIYSLSAASNSVVLDSITGTYAGQTVTGILFNAIAGAPTATVSLSVVSGVTFRVAPVYNGSEFALYLADRSSVLFTVATGTATQVVTAAPTTNIGPNERRLRALEII